MSIVKSILAPRVRTPRELWWFPVPRNLDRIGLATLPVAFGWLIIATKTSGVPPESTT